MQGLFLTLVVCVMTATSRVRVPLQSSQAVAQPPRVIFAQAPAALIRIEGQPRYEPVVGTNLQRIVNATVPILRDDIGTHYVRVLDGWMEAYSLQDSWAITDVPPTDSGIALRQAVPAGRENAITVVTAIGTPAPTHLSENDQPAIYVSLGPAVLVTTEGPPRFASIPGTALTYMENASERVFREPTDQQLYLRLDRTWVRSWRLEGPWQFIAAEQLPADFAQIPGWLRSVNRRPGR